MYVKPGCPYCQAAREGLREQGVEWEERDATTRRDWRDELHRHSNDTGIVPTIVGPEGTTIGWKGGG